MEGRYCCNEVVPFTVMVAIECTIVGVGVLFKEATKKGLSYLVFIAYSFAISTCALLLLMPFVFQRSRGLPSPFKLSLIFKIFLLGVIGFTSQLSGYKGLEYTTPILSSALSNLIPAFTFILAVFFRMEKVVDLRNRSTQAKILGTTLSILGAFIVVLYKGNAILKVSYQQQSPATDSQLGSSSQSNWVFGGCLLFITYFLTPIWYITQVSIMKEYPAEVIVVFLYNLCGTLISGPVCILLESNLSAWKINPDITLITIMYSGIFTGLSSLVHTWSLHLKGPLYVSIFKPLSIVIAATLSFIFLGDALYQGTVIGAVILSFGFYAVIWGKAKEEELNVEFGEGRTETPCITGTPLLQSYNVKDNKEIMYYSCC